MREVGYGCRRETEEGWGRESKKGEKKGGRQKWRETRIEIMRQVRERDEINAILSTHRFAVTVK